MLVFLRVHILADVTSLSVTSSSAGLNVLDEHCMPDQDRIPHASIHHNFVICNSFIRQIMHRFDFYIIFMCIIHTRQPIFMGRKYVILSLIIRSLTNVRQYTSYECPLGASEQDSIEL
jgi:hypothetical protein